jgi:hypothetical protein
MINKHTLHADAVGMFIDFAASTPRSISVC